MAFQISPGVNTSEIDLTTVVPGVSSIDAGFAGAFRWGPINDITLIDSEDLLVQTFQKPDANTFASFFTAANILNYTSSLHVVRCKVEKLILNKWAGGFTHEMFSILQYL